MSKWEMVRLGDIADLITKGTTPTTIGYSFQSKGINFIKIESISSNGIFNFNKLEHISLDCNQKLKRSILKENDILFSIAGALGRVAIVPKEILPANTNQALAIIRISNLNINLKYITFVLRSSLVYDQFEKQKQGVAQLNLSLKNISDFFIPLPPLRIQQKIADVLDKASALIELRKAELEKLDLLVKSQFIEMFGDPVTNPKGWKTYSFDEVFNVTSSKRILKSEWKSSGIPFLRVRDLVQLASKGSVDNEFYISEDLYRTLSDSDGISIPGDILMSATSTLGKCHIVKPNERFYFKDADVLRFRSKKELNPQYFIELMKTPYINNQIATTLGITTVSHLTIVSAKKIYMRYPDIEYQNQFSFFVKQVNKSKFVLQQSLEKLELNYKSLMQRCFRGEIY